MQSWTYFSNCNDKWHLRLFITVLVALDFATTCLNSIVLRHYSITNFGTPLYLISTVSTQDVQVILTTVVVFLVQLFLASRVYLLDHSWYAPAFITACATGALVSMILLVADNVTHSAVFHLSAPSLKIEMALYITFAAVADCVATIVFCWRLSSNGTGVKRTQNVFHQLLLYFITRGILVTLNQFVQLIIYEVQPVSLHWIPFQLISCKLYVNTTLAILNSRASLRTQLDAGAMDVSQCMPPIFFEDHQPSQTSNVEARRLG